MTEFTQFASIESALNTRFRGLDQRDWNEWQRNHSFATASEIPVDAVRACLRRSKRNYSGLGHRTKLKDLIAGSVDQHFLEEIGELSNLERLELGWPVTATDLSPLLRLPTLRHLSIDSPRKISEFSALLKLPALEKLFITNAKHMPDIEWLADARHLTVIGVEGGMWSPQRIPSLRPLAGLPSLQAFFGTTIKVVDKDVMPLAACPNLQFLGVAAFAPRSEFERLHAARPDIICSWFRPEPWVMISRPSKRPAV